MLQTQRALLVKTTAKQAGNALAQSLTLPTILQESIRFFSQLHRHYQTLLRIKMGFQYAQHKRHFRPIKAA